jgi:hypothetical protein
MKYVRESHGLKIRAIGFFTHKDFLYFLYVFKGAKLAKFIRYEVGWKVCLFSLTKFTENW